MSRNPRSVMLGADDDPLPDVPPALANLVRKLYCLEYRKMNPEADTYGEYEIPQWDGGRTRFGRNHKAVWPKLADFINRNQVDPYSYIRHAFLNARGMKTPTPPQLYTEATLADYRAYQSHVHEDLRHAWDRQAVAVDGQRQILAVSTPGASPRQTVVTALCDTSRVQASPLFRYCMAFHLEEASLCANYYPLALVEYAFQKAEYDTAWGANIPTDLQLAADAYRQRLAQ